MRQLRVHHALVFTLNIETADASLPSVGCFTCLGHQDYGQYLVQEFDTVINFWQLCSSSSEHYFIPITREAELTLELCTAAKTCGWLGGKVWAGDVASCILVSECVVTPSKLLGDSCLAKLTATSVGILISVWESSGPNSTNTHSIPFFSTVSLFT